MAHPSRLSTAQFGTFKKFKEILKQAGPGLTECHYKEIQKLKTDVSKEKML